MNERESKPFKELKALYDPDEFMIDNIEMYHYEVMNENDHIWMGFYFGDKNGHLNIFINDGKLRTRYEEFEKEPT